MYKKILVPVDGSDSSLRGLDEAVKLAKETGATLRLVHAVNEYFPDMGFGVVGYTQNLIDSSRAAGVALLNSAASKAREQGVKVDTVLLDRIGSRVSDLILDEAKEWPADLIAMGTHGRRGLGRLAMGSDAEMVLRSATVPVLLVRVTPEQNAK
jgi:nucleotide-binding universal stress UspA family protein